MAYDSNSISAMGAGSGKAPSVYAYSTNDTLVEVSSSNYFIDAVGLFEAGDIITLNYSSETTNGLTILICATFDVHPDGEHTIDFSVYGTFEGDVRATDEAGYQRTTISKVVDGANELQSIFTYRNNTDVIATIIASDYFIEAGLFLRAGDIIYTIANDSFRLLRVDTAGFDSVTVSTIALP